MNRDYIKLAQRVESMFGSEVDESELGRLAAEKERRLTRVQPLEFNGPQYREVPLSDNLTDKVRVWPWFWSSPVPKKRRNRLQDAISRVLRSEWCREVLSLLLFAAVSVLLVELFIGSLIFWSQRGGGLLMSDLFLGRGFAAVLDFLF